MLPSFLENQSVDEVHLRMMEKLPKDIETAEGGHPWNLTYPHANAKAYFAEYIMAESIKLIFPMFAENYAQIMEYHAESRGLKRKPASAATGLIKITGKAGTSIPIYSTFSTISINDQPSIDFHTIEEAVIGEDGTVKIPIEALLEGPDGNVAVNTIVLNASAIDDITSVTNEEETTGGVDIESIESLQQRIVELDMTMDVSYVGSPSDYKRWALSVPGTGSAIVVSPTDDTEPITIILTDANGNPASEELCLAVYNFIMRPDSRDDRLANINDQLQVIPPSTLTVKISATVELVEGATITQVKTLFIDALRKYILEATNAGEIKYTKVGAVLSGITTVNDYKDVLINGGTTNIPILDSQVPFINEDDITLNEGTV